MPANPITLEELRLLSVKDPKLSKITKENLIEFVLKGSNIENDGINSKLDNIANELKSIRDENSQVISALRQEVQTLKTEVEADRHEILSLQTKIDKQNAVISAHQKAWEELDAKDRRGKMVFLGIPEIFTGSEAVDRILSTLGLSDISYDCNRLARNEQKQMPDLALSWLHLTTIPNEESF